MCFHVFPAHCKHRLPASIKFLWPNTHLGFRWPNKQPICLTLMVRLQLCEDQSGVGAGPVVVVVVVVSLTPLHKFHPATLGLVQSIGWCCLSLPGMFQPRDLPVPRPSSDLPVPRPSAWDHCVVYVPSSHTTACDHPITAASSLNNFIFAWENHPFKWLNRRQSQNHYWGQFGSIIRAVVSSHGGFLYILSEISPETSCSSALWSRSAGLTSSHGAMDELFLCIVNVWCLVSGVVSVAWCLVEWPVEANLFTKSYVVETAQY